MTLLTGSTTTLQTTTLPTTTSLSTSTPFVIYTVGPFALEAGDVVLVTGSASFTRPMPGDVAPPDPWLWYYNSGTAWEGQFAEDHNPAAVSHWISRQTSATGTATSPLVARASTDNILQYMHHRVVQRAGMDFITTTIPIAYYNYVAKAAHTKPNAPAGTAVKVDNSGAMQVCVLRDL